MAFIKKENICICEEYTDGQGQPKKLWRTIGEISTLEGQNGVFQKIKLWGPGGFQECSVLEPRDNTQAAPPPQQQGGYQQPQQNYQQSPDPQGYSRR